MASANIGEPAAVSAASLRAYDSKELLRYSMHYSSFHGITQLVRARTTSARILWLLCFVSSSAYCFYSIVKILVAYFSYDVLISLTKENHNSIDFPAVTVCNLNPLNRNHSQPYIEQVLARHNISVARSYEMYPEMIKKLIMASIANDTDLTARQRRELGFDIGYMLLTCYYNERPCRASDFVWKFDYNYGNCFTFNSGYDDNGNKVEIRKINEAGSDRSFRLELFLGDDFTQGIYMTNSGARVAIHNQTIDPMINTEGQDLSTNYQTDLGITRHSIKKLSSPYSNCVQDNRNPNSFGSFYYKAIFNTLNMSTYRQKVCLDLCIQEHIKANCGCLDPSLPNIYGSLHEICMSIDSQNCTISGRITYSERHTNQDCCKGCPLECDSSFYTTTSSKSRYPSVYYTNFLREKTDIVSRFPIPEENVTFNHIQKNIVLLNVFYDELQTTEIREVPKYSGLSVFGNIGGNLGFFIGVSLLSFVEILELLIEFFFIITKKTSP